MRPFRKPFKRTEITCPACGKVMKLVRENGRFCSPKCRQKAYRQRKKHAKQA